MSMRQRISSGLPYELILGYSRAVRVDNLVFVSGTTPNWPDGSIDPDPEVQLRRCFEIVQKALMEAGGSLDDVVRTRIYLTDPRYAYAVEKVHGELFTEVRPANTTLVVAALLNPAWKVEIEVDAIIGTRDREHSDSA
jgi:enamine deaminase RidA (YjgF/YER057c/UK114 family)